jgi:hypothetical protein
LTNKVTHIILFDKYPLTIALEIKLEKTKDKFSTFEVMRICGIEQSRFYHWMRDEYLPEGELVEWGRGYKTVFNIFDLYGIALFKEFVNFSLSREVAKKYMNYAIEQDWSNIIENEYELMIIQYQKRFDKDEKGKDQFIVKEGALFLKDREGLGRLRQSQIGFFIDLKRIMNSVNRRL